MPQRAQGVALSYVLCDTEYNNFKLAAIAYVTVTTLDREGTKGHDADQPHRIKYRKLTKN